MIGNIAAHFGKKNPKATLGPLMSKRSNKSGEDKICVVCKKRYYVTPSHLNKSKACGKECASYMKTVQYKNEHIGDEGLI